MAMRKRSEEWDDEPMADDHRRQLIVEAAVHAADGLILDGSDGSVEETNYLTGQVALRFVQKLENVTGFALRKKEMMFPFNVGDTVEQINKTDYPRLIVRGIDRDHNEAWGEDPTGEGRGYRIVNPTSWKRVTVTG